MDRASAEAVEFYVSWSLSLSCPNSDIGLAHRCGGRWLPRALNVDSYLLTTVVHQSTVKRTYSTISVESASTRAWILHQRHRVLARLPSITLLPLSPHILLRTIPHISAKFKDSKSNNHISMNHMSRYHKKEAIRRRPRLCFDLPVLAIRRVEGSHGPQILWTTKA